MSKIKKCVVCGKYTLKKIHCKEKTKNPHPPKWLVKDKYSKYRVVFY